MNIQEIKIEKFPVVIISDTHCHIKRVSQIKSQYPHNQIICLGDITNLFSEKEEFNKHSINYFIENKIPCLKGNHESFISACHSDKQDMQTLGQVLFNISKPPKFNLESVHLEYLKNLPDGFKLNLPNGEHYLCFHNEPRDLWSFKVKGQYNGVGFKSIYPINDKTVGVLHGHLHSPFVEEFEGIKTKRYSIGAVKFESYATLTEQGIQNQIL